MIVLILITCMMTKYFEIAFRLPIKDIGHYCIYNNRFNKTIRLGKIFF
jgi:hypothetical protein